MSDDKNKQPQDKDIDFTVPTDLPDKSVDEDPFSAFRPDPEKYHKEMQSIENPGLLEEDKNKDQSDDNFDRYKPGYVEKVKEEPLPPPEDPEKIIVEPEAIQAVETGPQFLPEDFVEEKKEIPQMEISPRDEDKIQWESYEQTPPKVELDAEEKLFGGLSHLSNVMIFSCVWVPLIIYFIKPDNENIQFHAKQAALLGVPIASMFIILIALSVAVGPCVCCVGIPFGIAGLGFWFYSIYVTSLVFTGTNYRIPYISDWADSIYG